MTKTKFCELWAARILYETGTSMSAMKDLLIEFYNDVLENHKQERKAHTHFNWRDDVTIECDY
jgi:hypothetical protein